MIGTSTRLQAFLYEQKADTFNLALECLNQMIKLNFKSHFCIFKVYTHNSYIYWLFYVVEEE